MTIWGAISVTCGIANIATSVRDHSVLWQIVWIIFVVLVLWTQLRTSTPS